MHPDLKFVGETIHRSQIRFSFELSVVIHCCRLTEPSGLPSPRADGRALLIQGRCGPRQTQWEEREGIVCRLWHEKGQLWHEKGQFVLETPHVHCVCVFGMFSWCREERWRW